MAHGEFEMASITCEGDRRSPPTSGGFCMASGGCSGTVGVLGGARQCGEALGVPPELGDKPEEALAAQGRIWMLVGAACGAEVIPALRGSPGQGGGSDG